MELDSLQAKLKEMEELNPSRNDYDLGLVGTLISYAYFSGRAKRKEVERVLPILKPNLDPFELFDFDDDENLPYNAEGWKQISPEGVYACKVLIEESLTQKRKREE
ncbi:MAG: hypothetical protein AABW48_01415 [Nanoarchaeota archaeon]